jgi:hypothetical protein
MTKVKKYGLLGEVAYGVWMTALFLVSLSIFALIVWIPIHFIIKYW